MTTTIHFHGIAPLFFRIFDWFLIVERLLLWYDRFYNCIGSIFSFGYTDAHRITYITMMKSYCCKEYIIGFRFSSNLIFLTIFRDDPDLTLKRNLSYDLIDNLSRRLYNGFEFTPLNEKGFWSIILRYRIHTSIRSEHGFTSENSLDHFIITKGICRQSFHRNLKNHPLALLKGEHWVFFLQNL